MATKRMFSLQIVDTDAFLEMPLSTQALYFHLTMRADDEGFVKNPKRIMRLVACQEDDMRVLISKRFILSFESGIIVIKHWLIHNTIRMDRFNKTVYTQEKAKLSVKENKSYSDNDDWQPIGNQLVTQVKLSKVKLSKVKLESLQTQLKKHEEDYSQSMLEDFDLFWGASANNGKPLWENQKTWDLPRRLRTWKKKEEKWDWEKSQRSQLKEVNEMPTKGRSAGAESGMSSIGDLLK